MEHNIDIDSKQKIISLIEALIPYTKIYLFGSRARGTHNTWSDVDIALDANKELSINMLDELRSVLQATNMPYKIEVVDFHRIPTAMQNEIRKEGVLWKP